MYVINYDFSNFERIMFNIKSDQSSNRLRELKDELNKFFKDCQCKEVLYTRNTDKLFFGMCTMPYIDPERIMDVMSSTEKERINSYYIEIDSKLLELNLSARELVAILLHEVGHVVNDSQPIEEVRNSIASYLAKTNSHLILTDSIQYKELLTFAVKNSIRKMNSLFYRQNEELIADEFSVRCGYGTDLETAFKKIMKNSFKMNNDVDNKLIVLQWTLRLYKDVRIRRIPAIRSLKKGKDLTGSTLEKREMDSIIRRLQQIDDDALIQESFNFFKNANDVYKKVKYKGMKNLEEDLYEFSLRAKNVTDEDEALIIIRQLNIRISIIDDYISTEHLNEREMDRWSDLLNKYRTLREDLSKKTTYAEKYYGLFVQTPVVKSRFEV